MLVQDRDQAKVGTTSYAHCAVSTEIEGTHCRGGGVVGGGRAHQHTRTRAHARHHLVSQEEYFICQKLAVGWLTALKKLSVCWGVWSGQRKGCETPRTVQQTGCKVQL